MQKRIEFDADSLLRLMTHYSEGSIPVDSELIAAGVSKFLSGWIGLVVRSKEWSDADETPLHFRYEGKRTLAWQKDGSEPEWKSGVEGPKLQ